MGFPSYSASGSDTYKPPKKYTSEEMRAIRSISRDGQQRFEDKQSQTPATTENDNNYGPLVNPQEAEQLRQLKEDNELDNINEALKSIGDSPSTRQIFGR